jgi:ABC-type multidrug transport system permease subunit
MIRFVRAVWAIYKKDLALWAHDRLIVVGSLVPALAILLLVAAEAVAVGRSPVALVTLDRGPQGREMQQIFHQADVFRLTDASPQLAQALFKNLQVVAVITIPADFTQRVQAHESTPVDVTVNNLNLDFTNDIRRSVPDAITQFYAAQGSASPVKVTMQEQDLRSRDVDYLQYMVLPTIVLLLVTNGVVTIGTSTAGEWETRRIKEMLLSPVARSAIVIGKVLAGFTTTLLVGVLILALGAALGWTRPDGPHVVTSLLIMALITLFSTGLGVAVGAALRQVRPTLFLTGMGVFILFFLAGGIGVLAFEPIWLQNIAAFCPLTYGTHAMEQAVFYSSADQLGRDVLVLSLSGLAALVFGVLMMRPGIAS